MKSIIDIETCYLISMCTLLYIDKPTKHYFISSLWFLKKNYPKFLPILPKCLLFSGKSKNIEKWRPQSIDVLLLYHCTMFLNIHTCNWCFFHKRSRLNKWSHMSPVCQNAQSWDKQLFTEDFWSHKFGIKERDI